MAWFTRNGSHIPGHLVFHHCREMVTPAISFSAGVRCDKEEETMGQGETRGWGEHLLMGSGIFSMSWNKLCVSFPVLWCLLEVGWADSIKAPLQGMLASMSQWKGARR